MSDKEKMITIWVSWDTYRKILNVKAEMMRTDGRNRNPETRYYCSNSGIEIDRETWEDNEGMCDSCFFEYYQQIDDLESEE